MTATDTNTTGQTVPMSRALQSGIQVLGPLGWSWDSDISSDYAQTRRIYEERLPFLHAPVRLVFNGVVIRQD
jgi:hypothetical protein